MDKIKVTIPCDIHHNHQIITGFLILKDQGWDVEIKRCCGYKTHPFHGLPVVMAEYRGKKLLYDLWDGYQKPGEMRKCMDWADVYFKRSFSRKKNEELFPNEWEKILPLGFNYHLTHKKNPSLEPLWKAVGKRLQGRAPDRYFTPEVFEGRAEIRQGPAKILFLTRLWEEEPGLDEASNSERRAINEARIHIIRTLKARYGGAFVGGLNDLPIARQLAPDLIMPREYTERRRYVALLHSCDICIGTMGLYESIGWKTGEYVAAARAIVNETFHYSVPGDFAEGKNYLPFTTAQECIDAVQSLAEDPERLYAMKKANEEYYHAYLKPEVLVRNSLEMAEKIF